MNPKHWTRCDGVLDECSLNGMNVHQLKIKNDVRERREKTYFAYSWAVYTAWRTGHWFESSGKTWFFSFCRVYMHWFSKNLFAYHRRYPFEISTAMEVIGHADSEYTVIFYRELIPQNSSTVIWNSILSQIAISFFTF